MRSAATEFGIPAEVLFATAYAESRFHLIISDDGKRRQWIKLSPWRPTRRVDSIAALLNASVDSIQADPILGMRAAALLIARQKRENEPGLLGWRKALERWNGAENAVANYLYADEIMNFISHGYQGEEGSGKVISMLPQEGRDLASFSFPARPLKIEGYLSANAYFNPGASSHRPLGPLTRAIKYIVIHSTENSFPTILDFFMWPTTKVGAHYLIRASDGFVAQTADERLCMFHAACFNEESIGIEHEGYVKRGKFWFSDAMYLASAKLVKDIAHRYSIPLDRKHILGHAETPGCSDHKDPGSDWDWSRYMTLLLTP